MFNYCKNIWLVAVPSEQLLSSGCPLNSRSSVSVKYFGMSEGYSKHDIITNSLFPNEQFNPSTPDIM